MYVGKVSDDGEIYLSLLIITWRSFRDFYILYFPIIGMTIRFGRSGRFGKLIFSPTEILFFVHPAFLALIPTSVRNFSKELFDICLQILGLHVDVRRPLSKK